MTPQQIEEGRKAREEAIKENDYLKPFVGKKPVTGARKRPRYQNRA